MSEWVGERDMFCRTVSLQLLGVLLHHHLTTGHGLVGVARTTMLAS